MNTIKQPLAALLAILTVGVGLLLATGSAASAVPAGPCRVIVERVTAYDIQEGGNGDEIYLKIGDKRLPRSGKVRFPFAPLSRSGAWFGSPNVDVDSAEYLTVWEEDGGWNPDDRIGHYAPISCTQPGARVIHFWNHNAHYAVDLTVTSS